MEYYRRISEALEHYFKEKGWQKYCFEQRLFPQNSLHRLFVSTGLYALTSAFFRYPIPSAKKSIRKTAQLR